MQTCGEGRGYCVKYIVSFYLVRLLFSISVYSIGIMFSNYDKRGRQEEDVKNIQCTLEARGSGRIYISRYTKKMIIN